jgi:hypothetical protein
VTDRIEIKKFYRTRGGKMALITDIRKDGSVFSVIGVVFGLPGEYSWSLSNGKCTFSEHANDLMSEVV